MPHWEYKTQTITLDNGQLDRQELDNLLNALGNDGWELLTVTPVLLEGRTESLVHHFRRTSEPKRRAGFQP